MCPNQVEKMTDKVDSAIYAIANATRQPLQDLEAIVYGLRKLQSFQHQFCVDAGWYTDPATGEKKDRNVGEMIALIHSEISEAMEGHRKRNAPDDHLPERAAIEVELADAVLRIADLAGYLGIDIGGALIEKWAFNANRQDHKLSARALPGGKNC